MNEIGRDPASRTKTLAEAEREAHVKKNRWENLNYKEKLMHDYQCGICGYLYEPANGDPEGNIPANTAFENLPDDWVCPICGAGKDQFTAVS